ncbi:MAG: radical SAM protein [Pseudomonadota bacterium]
MNKSKVVLVQPPIQDFYLTIKRTIPYGLASIAASIIQEDFEVKIIDGLATSKSKIIEYPPAFSYLEPFYGKKDITAFSLFHEFRHFGYSYEHLGNLVRQEQPFIVGISSLFTAYSDQALETARMIKKFYPQCLIVMGGHHPTIFPEKVLDYDSIDYLIRGEGEIPMAKLCTALKTGTDVKKIPGVCYKDTKGMHICDPFWVKDLSNLPCPATALINHDYYQRKKRISATIVSSRGCPMQCSYCSVSATSSYGGYRKRSVDSVIEEIQMLIQHHDVGFVDFEDENLCLDKEWFFSLFNRIVPMLSKKNIELRAMNGLYPPSIDEDIVKLMKKAGFKTLNLALGSTSIEQLKQFKRKDVRQSFENAVSLAQKNHLECVSYIIGAAPGQSVESSLNDLLYLASQRTLVGFSVYYPSPGSLDYQECQSRQLLPKHFCQMRSTALPIEDTTTRVQSITLLRLSRILNFIKAILDSDGQMPDPVNYTDPEHYTGQNILSCLDRTEQSKKLLQWFLYDGVIRGLDHDKEIYEHCVDLNLTRQFIQKMKTIQISGVKQE